MLNNINFLYFLKVFLRVRKTTIFKKMQILEVSPAFLLLLEDIPHMLRGLAVRPQRDHALEFAVAHFSGEPGPFQVLLGVAECV